VYDPILDNWRHQAKCRGMDTELWFPPRDKNLYKVTADQAKAVCLGKDGAPACPVRTQCLLEAEANEEVHGIWGGMSHRERNALKRKAAKKGMTLQQIVEKGV
jgi:WhiB family transcriptional regulator, redox-sensing transcriptional regulator